MAVAFVKKGTVAIVDSGTSIAPTIGTVTAGNLVVAMFWVADGTGSTTALSAPSGWTAAETPTGQLSNGFGMKVGVFYKQNAASGSHTATLSMGTGSYSEGIIVEFSGASTTAALGVHTNNKGGTATSGNTGTTGTSTVADAVAVAVIAVDNGVNTSSLSTPAATGYTSIAVEPNDSFHVPGEASYKILSATGTQSGSWTWTNSSGFCAAVVVFQADPSGGVSLTPGAGSLALSGPAVTLARTANVSFTPGQAALTLSGPAPTLAQTSGTTLTPGVAALTLTGPAPTLARTANQSFTPGAASITLAGPVPTVSQASGLNLIPATKTVSVSTFAPTVAQTANVALVPATGVIAFAGPPPSFVQTGGSVPYPLGSGGGPLQYFPSQASIYAQALRERNLQWIREEQAKTRRLEKRRRKKAKALPPDIAPPKVEWVRETVETQAAQAKPHPIEDEIRAAVKAEQERIRKKRKQEEAVLRALSIFWN